MKSKLLFLATTLLFASCWENKANKEQQTEENGDSLVQTEKLTFSKSGYNINKKILDGVPNYTISIEVKYAEGNSIAAKRINKMLTAFLFGKSSTSFEEAKCQFIDSLETEYVKELKEFYDPDNEYKDTYSYSYSQTGKVSENAPEGVVAYTNRIEVYTGGAHGGVLESYINFDKATGKLITCKELFGNKQDDVYKLIKAKIIKDNDCKNEQELIEKRDIFTLGDVYISDNNFQLEKDSILFCYNPYEIAPWSEGFIFARLSYKELEGLIKQDIIKE